MDDLSRPVRLRLSRAKGFDLQAASLAINGLPAVAVARPTIFGNPYSVDIHGAAKAVAMYRKLLTEKPSHLRHLVLSISSARPGIGEGAVLDIKNAIPRLRGKNLACWCALDGGPCHADVLLELANAPAEVA